MGDNVSESDLDTVWHADFQSFDFFSVFLQRQILNAEKPDLSFVPMEYLEQVVSCTSSEDGQGYINLLVMLFVEHYQKSYTGRKQVSLPDEKYEMMAKQLILFCTLEQYRRKQQIGAFKFEHIFDSNMRTTLTFSDKKDCFPKLFL